MYLCAIHRSDNEQKMLQIVTQAVLVIYKPTDM